VLNKIDVLDAREREGLAARKQPRHQLHQEVLVSAQTGEGVDALLAAIDKALFSDPVIETELRVPQSDGAALAAIEGGMVVHSRAYEGNLVRLSVSGPASLVGRLRKYRTRAEDSSGDADARRQVARARK